MINLLIEHVLIPFLAAVGGGLCGTLGTLAAIRYVEWFRRLARWEPYAQSLWLNQVEITRSVVEQTGLVCNAALGCVNTANNRQKFCEYGRQVFEYLEPLTINGERLILLKTEFNQAVTDFVAQALKATLADTKGALPSDYAQKLWMMQQLIVAMARKELGVGALHSRTSAAVQDARDYQDLLKAFEAVKPQSPTSADAADGE